MKYINIYDKNWHFVNSRFSSRRWFVNVRAEIFRKVLLSWENKNKNVVRKHKRKASWRNWQRNFQNWKMMMTSWKTANWMKKKQKKQKKKLRTNDVFLFFLANYLIDNCKFFVRCRNINLLDFIVYTIICSEHYVKMQVLFRCRTHFVRLKMLILMLYTIRTIKRCW